MELSMLFCRLSFDASSQRSHKILLYRCNLQGMTWLSLVLESVIYGPFATTEAANDEVLAMNRWKAVWKCIEFYYVPKECIRSVISIKFD
jgi:hypothetical protein